MGILKKSPDIVLPEPQSFTFAEKTVQGAKVAKQDNAMLIRSPKRFKLFTEGTDRVYFAEGSGHFKWKRGEPEFAAGDFFIVQPQGEYEINGDCLCIVVRE